ncbi:MAG: hypothetical protein IJP28_03770, partial [Erysipelotrichales bacterium]|nr:hypothetical protein [Erysipelotrichales bacterium]
YLEAVKALENFNEEKMDEYEIELMEYAINEIEDADIGENELDEIDATLKRMSQSEHIKEKGNEALSLLEGDNGALESLYSAVQAISSIRIEECEEIEEGLRNYYYELEELKSKLSQFVENSFLDEEEYRRLQERGFMIRKLFRKYGGSYHSLMEEVESMREKLSHAVDYEAYLLKLENAKDDAMDRALKSASLLHKSRMNHTTELVNAMHHELQDLSLPSAQFIVVTQETDLSPNGIDEVIFEVSMNKGEAFKPLMKVASGGELSRFMLGLKVVLAQREKTPVMIFDEIDSGISGATAYAVGHKMLALSKYTQVFSVTHLAQVAAACDHLYFISKREEEGVTFSSVQELDDTLKIEKLALIGSGNISETSISNAQEMIAKARQV